MPESQAQKETIRRVMHEAKHGELKTAGGRTVRNPKQAIAIALHEAGASRDQSPATQRRTLVRTKARERDAQTGQAAEGSRAALYAEARRRGIAGRSRMNKQQLEEALRR